MDRDTRQEVMNRRNEDLSSTVNQLDLTEIYRTLNLETAENKFFLLQSKRII